MIRSRRSEAPRSTTIAYGSSAARASELSERARRRPFVAACRSRAANFPTVYHCVRARAARGDLLMPHFSYLLGAIRILAAPAVACLKGAVASDPSKTRVVARPAAMWVAVHSTIGFTD